VSQGLPSSVDALGLPTYPPSSMPTRFYDATEYDVAPLHLPLDLPNPPPPPATFFQTGSTVSAAETAVAVALANEQQAAAAAAARGRAQFPISAPPQHYSSNRAAPSFLQSSSHVYRAQQQQQQQQQQRRGHSHNRKHNRRHRSRNNEQEEEQPQQQEQEQEQRQNNFANFADRMRFMRQRNGQRQRHSQSQGQGQVQRNAAAMRAAMGLNAGAGAGAGAMSGERLTQTTLYSRLPAYVPFGMRPAQPSIAESPMSIAARGPVPHFHALVRELPSEKPLEPYAGFFEAQARLHPNYVPLEMMSAPVAPGNFGRPVEPVLPPLPPPPIVLAGS